MLAERTEEHRALFEEDREAAYFSSTEELIEKVKFYLDERASPEKDRTQRDFAGLTAPYTYQAQLENALAQL